jgi:hypothetical protein
MGKNFDSHNIFDSYLNKVVLNEAVKPTEGGGGNLNPQIEQLKALLTNPNLKPEDKAKAQASLDTLTKGAGSSTPPAGTMTVDQAKQVIANQQAQNTTPSQGTVVNAPDVSSSATNSPVAKTRGEAAALRERGQLQAQPAPNKYNNVQVPYPNPKNRGEAAANNEAIQKANSSQAASAAPAQQSTTPTAPTQTASTAPQAQQSDVSITDPNSVSLGGQPAKPADDFQQKLDASYSEFKKGAPTSQQATQPKAQSSGGGSVVDYLAGSGQASDFGSRSKLAAQYGIQGYKGTAEQNTQLLSKLKSGEKPAAQQAATQPAAKQQGMGGAVGAVSKGIGSVGNVAKRAAVGNQPLGGALGAISKGIGSVGNVAKRALVGDNKPKETEKKEESEEGFVQFEKTNIAKFLKCLSDKNYSKANKYLKAIVENKVKKNIMRGINTI